MKYVVVLGDGMADRPVPELGGRTPLQVARKPNIDSLARRGEVGLARTVPESMPPASDVANLAVMGYDPALYYTGRSPLEAISMGLRLAPDDVAYRCNLVTLEGAGAYEDRIMLDYCGGEISTEEGRELMAEVDRHMGRGSMSSKGGSADGPSFHGGISYRHCMIWKGGPERCGLTPPHDIPLMKIGDYLPRGEANRPLLELMRESNAFLEGHPVNRARIGKGLRPANSIWLWGEGRRPAIPSFRGKFGVEGAMISAVDLLKGLAICVGMRSVDVEGATGDIHTNFAGKADAALRELDLGADVVYVHVEAPDECGHRHEVQNKVRSIELIDELVVGRIVAGLEARGGTYRMLVTPDHPTPLAIRTHSRDPVPFVLFDSSAPRGSDLDGYDEYEAAKTGIFVEHGHELMGRLLKAHGA